MFGRPLPMNVAALLPGDVFTDDGHTCTVRSASTPCTTAPGRVHLSVDRGESRADWCIPACVPVTLLADERRGQPSVAA